MKIYTFLLNIISISGFVNIFKRSIIQKQNMIIGNEKKDMDVLDNNIKGELTWYVIGFDTDFDIKLKKKITIRNKNYIIWKDGENYYGLKDACSHQGSSFYFGEIKKDCIRCPYHGYTFNSCGKLIDIPGLDIIKSNKTNIESFKVIKKNNMIYINTIPITDNEIDENLIWEEPEAKDPKQRVVYLEEEFEHNAKFVTVNSLDICHIGFVHTFGNNKNPNPINNSNIMKINDSLHHYKIKYEYLAGENSIVNKLYSQKKIYIENEYILPHTTVARVIFGNYSSTIITMALPISEYKTKLFVKAYRNYWNINNLNIFNFLLFPILNKIGDMITKKLMYDTLKQDKKIIDNIDKTDYKTMHGLFSIKYDMMGNHYKHNYKKKYE